MPYYATSQEWLHQSSLLLEARPNTTRITTKYHISKPKPRRPSQKPTTSSSADASALPPPRGSLTLKTYDPHSGACLKYRTTKAAEVSRLILSLGRPLGGRMAALPPPEAADEVMADVLAGGEETVTKKGGEEVVVASSGGKPQAQGQGPQQQQGGGGGKGKKKRGKK
ncbi:signal recognition particle 9 kDa protein-domain-containing protein [Hypoxylon rubiginosum]|uniref:Signal recognition particle 9 kDa protein-domain-containing protein n=1 Tax=Hypoxylon rubiginosum TaxID=110542 RepID=A0ACB9ZE51_9PEZI|nr:signal recognition particle 9 kDa protein-domain-containing protein [Hypoxylon rubiginosum]